jgi:hypothetical protein
MRGEVGARSSDSHSVSRSMVKWCPSTSLGNHPSASLGDRVFEVRITKYKVRWLLCFLWMGGVPVLAALSELRPLGFARGPRLVSAVEPWLVSAVEPRLVSAVEPRLVSAVEPRLVSAVEPRLVSAVEPLIVLLALKLSDPSTTLGDLIYFAISMASTTLGRTPASAERSRGHIIVQMPRSPSEAEGHYFTAERETASE